MKTTEIVGFKREEVGSKSAKILRAEGNVPCVLYGGKDTIHFHAPAYLFRDLLYSPNAYIVNVNVEGVEKRCVLQDAQFHPVSDHILHVDFLEIFDKKPVTMEVPVEVTGSAPGAQQGGQVYLKSKKLKVKAIPSNLPGSVTVDVSSLDLGKSIKVKDIETEGYEITTPEQVSIVSVIIPRSLRSALKEDEAAEELEAAEAAEAEGAAE